jgi:hypothetical protein
LELALESFVDLIAQESFLSAIVIDKIGLKTTNESNFSDLFLSFHALSEFVFFGEVGWYFWGLILVVIEKPGIFFVLNFHKSGRPGLKGHFIFLLFVFFQLNLIILYVAFLHFIMVLLSWLFLCNLLGDGDFIGVFEDFIFLVVKFLFDGLQFEQQSFEVCETLVKFKAIAWCYWLAVDSEKLVQFELHEVLEEDEVFGWKVTHGFGEVCLLFDQGSNVFKWLSCLELAVTKAFNQLFALGNIFIMGVDSFSVCALGQEHGQLIF